MNYQKIISRHLGSYLEAGTICFDIPLKDHCSFKIGGPAEALAMPEKQSRFIEILAFCIAHGVPYLIIGKGSNLLIPDSGFRGMVISTVKLDKLTRDENFISAGCGASLRSLCEFARDEGLSGLEFASGIPGSVGGAVYMNAGAYDGEIKDVLYCSKYLIPELQELRGTASIKHLKREAHDFSYRHSAFQDKHFIHLSSVFQLSPADPEQINTRMEQLDKQRWDKQPMDLPSAGSVFKRPAGYFTGKLVDDCGLRGFRIGDAAVSDKHCGFIVNLGEASYQDVIAVIRHVQSTVMERFGVHLETEIRILPGP